MPAKATSTLSSLATLRQSLMLVLDRSGKDAALAAVVRQSLAELEQVASRQDERRQRERLAALYEVSQALGSSLNLDEVLNQVMDAIIKLSGAGRGFLMLIRDNTGELDLRAARNIERATLEQKDMEVSRTVVRQVAESGEPLVTTNALNDPRFSASASVMLYKLRSIVCVPLRVRGKVSGVIYVDNNIQDGLFNEEDLALFAAFANQAAVAIENARLYTLTDAALAERVAELETLQRIDRELNTSLNFERVLELTLSWAVRGAVAEEGWIGLTLDNDEKPGMRIVAGKGKGNLIPTDSSVLPPTLAAGHVARFPASEGRRAYLVAPILREGNVIGLIGLDRRADFTADDQTFLERLADHAAVAIENTRLYEAVQAANAAKSQFVSVVTHELRIPMTSIKGYTDLLRGGMVGAVNDQQRQFLDTIRSNVDRMNALVSDLADISRIETGRLNVEFGTVSVAELVKDTLDGLRPQIESKGQAFHLHLPDDLPPASTDPARLTQILTNLLSNANKYTPAGGSITLRAEPLDSLVKLSVTDSGLGISADDQQQLFVTQFFRSENPAVREQQGWGLGLNVTRRLVELMGGQIGVTSEPGKGSTFWFTVPRA